MITEIQRQTQLYALGLSVSAVALCVGLLLAGYTSGATLDVLALILVNAVAERSRVWITRTTQMSIALLPTLLLPFCSGRWLRASLTRRRCWAIPSCSRGLP